MNDDDGSAAETAEGRGVEESDRPDETTRADTGGEESESEREREGEVGESEPEGDIKEDERSRSEGDEEDGGDEREESERRIEELEAELDRRNERIEGLESNLKRTQADFQNYKKRREREEQRLRETATEDLVTRLLDVRDNLVRATEQDENADIREGVEATLREFDRVLDAEEVSEVAPEPGTDVEPQRHEVMARVASDQPEGAIDEVYTSGYEMGEKLLRPAQVTVSEGSEGDER